MSDWVGQVLSKVEIRKRLGRGRMAEVFLGHHISLDRSVAVKILHSHLAEDEALLTRFRAEAQAIAALRHPNIVQVFDFDVADGRPYIVMELLEGIPLDDYLRELHGSGRKLPPETTLRLVTSLAAALQVIIYQKRLPDGNRRRVTEIIELRGLENDRYGLQPLMRYNPETDKLEATGVKPGWV